MTLVKVSKRSATLFQTAIGIYLSVQLFLGQINSALT